jgi:predicted RNA-binding Zn-ribbon protein involved in translation (DUF1610 family)
MSKKKFSFKPDYEIPLAAMCVTPTCKTFIDLTKGEAPTKCPSCGNELEVWGIEVQVQRKSEV